jgi:hypothetical protein
VGKVRIYKKRANVDWFDSNKGVAPKHNQKDIVTGLYYNELKGTWHTNKLRTLILNKSKFKLYDFNYYGIKDIKRDFGLKIYEKIAMFITVMYQKEIGGGYKVTDWEKIYWSTKDLETILGKGYWKNIIGRLIEMNLIKEEKESSQYHFNKEVRYFTLNKGFMIGQMPLFREVDLVNSSYQKRINKLFEKVVKERKGILKYLEKVLDNSSLFIDDFEQIANQIWLNKLNELDLSIKNRFKGKFHNEEHKRIIKSYYDYLVMIQMKKDLNERRALYGLNRTKNGNRVVHMFSNAPKLFREFLKIDGEEVVEIDIVSSQPSFLFVMMKKWYDFNNPNRNIVNSSLMYLEKFNLMSAIGKDLYNYMAFRTKGLKYLNDTNARKEMKALFFRLIFGNPRYKLEGKSRKDLIIDIFGLDMYEFLMDITNVEMGYKKKTSNLATLLQKEESLFMDKVIDKLMIEKLNFLPLYDSLIVKKCDAHRIRFLFNQVIKDENLATIIKIK